MSSLFSNILGWILVYKYLTLFLVTFLSSLGIPLPAGSSTIASAAFASQGYLNIFVVLLVGVMGNLSGDLAMYGLARRYGRRVLYWLRLKTIAESEALKHVEDVANHYSGLVIIASRFQDQATTIVNIISGLGHMQFKRFLGFAIIGEMLQICFYASIGYFFAENWQSLYKTIGAFSWLIVLTTLVISIVISHKVTKRMLK